MFSFLSRYIAGRYMFARKSHAVVNIISLISVLAVAVPTAAMIILLSVYNGLDGFLRSLYGNFDVPVRISASKGKSFEADSLLLDRIQSVDGVDLVTRLFQENALMEYRDKQHIGTVLGVDTFYRHIVPIEQMIDRGEYRTRWGGMEHAVVGMGVAYTLGVNVTLFDRLTLYAPSAKTFDMGLNLSPAYRHKAIFPVGVFMLDEQTDSQYTIVSLEFAHDLFGGNPSTVTALGVLPKKGVSMEVVAKNLKEVLGDTFKVEDRYQQKETMYRIMKYEKLGIYFISVLVLLIASLTLVSSLIMLLIDKQDALVTLRALGLSDKKIREVFVLQGCYIALAGTFIGLFLGVSIALIQQYFGIIKIGGSTMLMDAYPVEVHMIDVLIVVVTIVVIDYLISVLTVRAAMREEC